MLVFWVNTYEAIFTTPKIFSHLAKPKHDIHDGSGMILRYDRQ